MAGRPAVFRIKLSIAMTALDERAWIATPGIPADFNGPSARDYVPFPDLAGVSSISTLLAAAAARHPQRVAVDGADGRLHFAALLDAVRTTATAMQAVQPNPGRLGILLPSNADYVIAVYAAITLGRPCVLMDDTAPALRNAHIARESGINLLIVSAAHGEPPIDGIKNLRVPRPVRAAAAVAIEATACRLDDAAFVLYTSGSTGLPKAIVHSQRTLLHWARTTHNALHVTPADTVLSLSPFATLGGCTALFTFLLAGATMYFVDLKTQGFAGLLGALREGSVTILRATPSMLRSMLLLPDAAPALASLRAVQTYGEPLLKKDLATLRRSLPPDCYIRSTYGATEASGLSWFATETDEYDPVRVATGTLLPDTLAAIVDERGSPCAVGEVGELWIRSRYNALGELHDGELVAGRLEPHPSADGSRVFRTGDMARLHPDGVFVVLGRRDRMAKINGQRIEPAEIEVILRSNPAVADARVVVAREASTVRLIAAIVPRGEPPVNLLAELRADLRRRVPGFMVPSRLLLIEAIPLLSGGKIDESALLIRVGAGAHLT
ncbi:MAG: hypothetical protein NVSMB10_10000 [Steroidobacteraceae bacterium]